MIHLNNVSLRYPIFNANGRSLKRQLLSLSGARLSSEHGYVSVRALNNINLSMKDGDRVGLIGFNGAGKSTLLRVLAGIYQPTEGSIERVGRVAPLLDISAGLDPECTGYENILLKAMSLGLRRGEINEVMGDIASFTELSDYLSVPVRTYSSGMMMRLAFAVCTSVQADIILMDEWLGVGDGQFLKKATEKLHKFVDQSRILVLASHNNQMIKETCNKALLMNNGNLIAFGPVDEVLEQYGILGDKPFFLPADYVEANPDLNEAVRRGLVSAWTHFMSLGIFESRPLGNGVHLDQFSEDPVYLRAKEQRDAVMAVKRIAEILPHLRAFRAPEGWTASIKADELPDNFIPVNACDLK